MLLIFSLLHEDHCQIMRYMELDQDSVIILHMGVRLSISLLHSLDMNFFLTSMQYRVYMVIKRVLSHASRRIIPLGSRMR